MKKTEKLNNQDLLHNAIEILQAVNSKISDKSDMAWVRYDYPEQLRQRVNNLIYRINEGDINAIKDAQSLFLPTAVFQEHAISNGWSEEYMQLSSRFDNVYKQLKEYG